MPDRKDIQGVLVQQGLRDFKAIDKTSRILLAAASAGHAAGARAGGIVGHLPPGQASATTTPRSAVVDRPTSSLGASTAWWPAPGSWPTCCWPRSAVDVFGDVYSTKVDSLRTLLQSVRGELGFLLVFSSAVGRTGNRGEIDYTAANDALDFHGHPGQRRPEAGGCWSSTGAVGLFLGMVYDELGKLMEAVGIGAISPAEEHRLRARRPGTDRREPAR